MRSGVPTLGALGALVAGSALSLTGCTLPQADGKDEPAPIGVELSFAYQADGGEGFIDQTLTIANNGDAAGAPDLDIVAVDAQGVVLPDVEVVTAFGSDRGEQVVPAYTEVIEVLKFKGPDAADVADVEVTVTAPGTLPNDLPKANDIKVKRFDISGSTRSENTLGSVLVANTYDKPIRVMVVGIEYAPVEGGEPQHFQRVSPLAGPIDLEPGEKVRERVADKYRTRFYGSVRAFLVG
ncbi:hypothetical protein [Nocardioides sp.]|uniref:hypothetical protein n=1 Tax=Nocardioides sp. TaxID=35761 RepID=UPI0027293B7E|nr:hypothetical protein [Nocardioides sp.]MDO9456145.1 hypothetical protein [Nocardioides sp.]